MKITKQQLKQIIEEEIETISKKNSDYFAVIAPNGSYYKVRKGSKNVENDPQKAVNLIARRHPHPKNKYGDYRVHEFADFGYGVRKNPIFVGKSEETASEDDDPGFILPAPKEDPMGRGSRTSALRRSVMRR